MVDEGAIPTSAARVDEGEAARLLSHLARVVPAPEVVAGLGALELRAAERHRSEYFVSDLRKAPPASVVFLLDGQPDTSDLLRLGGELVGAGLFFRDTSRLQRGWLSKRWGPPAPSKAFLRWKVLVRVLHEEGGCRACFVDPHESHPSAFGVHEYGPGEYEGIACPYLLERRSQRPARWDDLPDELRPLVAARFEALEFAATPALQPLEHLPCRSYNAAYLASDRLTLRATPGEEAGFLEQVSDLQEEYPELRLDNPEGAPAEER